MSGTDTGCGFTPFDGLPEELALMCRSGMPTMAVIQAATSRVATVRGREHEIGSVTPGLEAGLIAGQGGPLTDIRALRELRLVMQAVSVQLGGQVGSVPAGAAAG